VNITLKLWDGPAFGTIKGVVNAKVPFPEPPVSVTSLKACPRLIADADGQVTPAKVALFTVTFTVVTTLL
jgi:hypothetical protein